MERAKQSKPTLEILKRGEKKVFFLYSIISLGLVYLCVCFLMKFFRFLFHLSIFSLIRFVLIASPECSLYVRLCKLSIYVFIKLKKKKVFPLFEFVCVCWWVFVLSAISIVQTNISLLRSCELWLWIFQRQIKHHRAIFSLSEIFHEDFKLQFIFIEFEHWFTFFSN